MDSRCCRNTAECEWTLQNQTGSFVIGCGMIGGCFGARACKIRCWVGGDDDDDSAL